MRHYSYTQNNVSAPNEIPIEKKLLSVASNRACLLVVGPHLAMQSHSKEGNCNSDTSSYLRSLVKDMVEWCIQQSIIDQPDTIETFRQLPYRESLAHAGNMLEEYLIEKQQLQLCLAEVLQRTSQVSQVHQKLAHLPFRGYISTTYDTFIETTYEQVRQRELPKFYAPSIGDAIHAYQHEKQFILKLYGDIADPASIVFGPRLNKGLSSIDEKAELRQLLAASEVIFLGFEETDPDLKYLTSLLQESQPYNLLTISQLQTLIGKHHTNWWEDSSNNMNTSGLHPPPTNIVLLPEAETHTIPIASTSSRTHRPRPQEMPSPTFTHQAPPIEIYTAYAHADERFFSRIKEQLDILRRQGWPISCHESEIINSTTWQRTDHLATARLILLLVSTTFLNSDFCYCEQLDSAIERHGTDNLCYVIPILLRPLLPLLLKGTPFGKLDFLPTNGKAISTWTEPRNAYNNITAYLLEKLQDMTYYP